MTDYVHDHFKKHAGPVRPHILCKDGFSLSVQASRSHYCEPREDNAERYENVEVWATDATGKRTRHDPEGWVPVEKVNTRIRRHGGLATEA